MACFPGISDSLLKNPIEDAFGPFDSPRQTTEDEEADRVERVPDPRARRPQAPEILHALLDRHQPGWESRGPDLNALALAKNDIYLEIARDRLENTRSRRGLPLRRGRSHEPRRAIGAAHRRASSRS